MNTFLRLILLCCLLFSSCAFSQEPSQKEQQLEKLKSDISKLNAEMDTLKSEVRQLRNLIVIPSSSSSSNTLPEDTPSTSDKNSETGYWCTKSNKRHNSSCRYYKTSNGHPCGPKDGTECKLCGG
ncbi:MAG: hypothetical protein GX267_04600 [Fibrobacter sp.]|jgi:outer membrane murein-binding lipoprotein Lpp|nr:hypothetical protein [Fibrobacter sp.]